MPEPGELRWFETCGSNINAGEWKVYTDKVTGVLGDLTYPASPRWVPVPPQLKQCRYCQRMSYESRCDACGAWL